MSQKIVLIDGHSILNRAFYGLPDLTNSEGLHTNAVYGFLTILFKILEEETPEYLTVAFDVHAPTFRHEMYAEYKGTRKPMAEELRQQVPVMKDVLKAMGIKTIECAGLEADDLIGTLSARCEKEGMEVSVISGDRDLLQLATDHVKIRIPKTRQGRTEVEDYYAADVKERYQVTPSEFIDLKALMGDSSDNIPGVPGIGEKTAAKIIVKYHSIENAHAHADELKPPRAANAMKEHWDLAVMSKELATINVNAEFPYELAEAKLENIYGPTEATVACTYFEFNKDTKELPEYIGSMPIGKAYDGMEVELYDDNLNKITDDSTGQIVLSGKQLAKGYVNNEAQTKEKFIKINNKDCYLTGDLGRWVNGELVFLGRNDAQVQIRGYRVEIFEIENAISKIDGIISSAVIPTPVGAVTYENTAAFLVCNKNIDTNKIKDDLSKTLPNYMVPNKYIILDSMPLNSNGKIDRNQLKKLLQ